MPCVFRRIGYRASIIIDRAAQRRRHVHAASDWRPSPGPSQPSCALLASGGGLTEIGARNYDPDTGRFISDDPTFQPGDPQQLNGYTYDQKSGDDMKKELEDYDGKFRAIIKFLDEDK